MADPPPPSPTLDVIVRQGVRAADGWQAHALADLAWADDDRPSDELRATVRSLWRATILRAAERLAEPLGWTAWVEPALAVLADAGWSTPDRLRPALISAQHRLLRARLIAAAQPFGATDPLDELSGRTGRTGTLARAVLSDRDEEGVVLSAEAWHELCWACAAALRVVASRSAELTVSEDAGLRDAVAAALAGHDEAAGIAVAAHRLARRLSPDRLMPGEALLAGHTHLAIALLAQRVTVPATLLSDWLLAPDPMPFAVALRAGGEDVAGVGGLLAALTGAGGRSFAPLADRIAGLHDLSVEAAGELLREWAV